MLALRSNLPLLYFSPFSVMINRVNPLFLDKLSGVIGAVQIIISGVFGFHGFLNVEGDGFTSDSQTQLSLLLGMAIDDGICGKIERSRSSSSSFLCFFTLDGKGRFDDLEGWFRSFAFPDGAGKGWMRSVYVCLTGVGQRISPNPLRGGISFRFPMAMVSRSDSTQKGMVHHRWLAPKISILLDWLFACIIDSWDPPQ
ncbi:hypothetical protein Tco_0789791 [Tanacetum coccineum]